ncbi:hypothetical protein MHUMG1_10177 [Metarhizium humberi]|uniref:Protein-arginine deiminase C-terminal domain-containing protein n=1 Tax=Metarhizium humberi TaxID=2596975 RepID=A0A9P8S2Y3_9HYPO|nr:hypothetical protein MHUMG1_10177 [Metarhizium humberi]
MRLAFLVAALPLTGAIPQGPPGKRAEAPDPISHNLKNDGAVNHPEDEPLAAPHQPSTPVPATIGSFRVTILADSNRDGKVDVTGNTDLAGKETWTAESGALFLANIVDTDQRCSSQITGSCASKLGDIFPKTSLPKSPRLDPELAAKKRNRKEKSDSEWLKVLSESDKATYNEYLKKLGEFWDAPKEVNDLRISECHDSSDDVLRNSLYLAPLRTVPNPGLSDSATGSITVFDETAASKVRLFYKAGGQWTFITPNYTFQALDLKAGLELGIDARDVRRPGGWDGRVTVEFRVKDGEREAKDSVALRVAPVLTQHHGQSAEQLLTASGYPRLAGFVKDLGEMSSTAGLKKPLYIFENSECIFSSGLDIWSQDFFEPGYMSIPGPSGLVSIRIMIRSAQADRPAGRKVFQELRSNTVGALQTPGRGGTLDSLGNLETIPPYTYNGKSYAAGRTVMGSAGRKKPYMMAFLEAQETQAPIELDTSWLKVKHTDEFIQFLPVQSKRGWVMMVNNPRAGLEILQKAQLAGHGKLIAVSRPRSDLDPPKWRVTNTINDVLNTPNFAGFQDACASNIEKSVNAIKRETGITDAEIIRIPSLYQVYDREVWQYGQEADRNKRRQIRGRVPAQETRESGEQQGQRLADVPEEDVGTKILNALEAGTPPRVLEQQPANIPARSLKGRQEEANGEAAALYPSTINSVVLGNRQILAPNPWGPVIDGQDVLSAAVNAAYAKANYTVRYIDDWFTHYTTYGDVHCASNVIREIPTAKWW